MGGREAAGRHAGEAGRRARLPRQPSGRGLPAEPRAGGGRRAVRRAGEAGGRPRTPRQPGRRGLSAEHAAEGGGGAASRRAATPRSRHARLSRQQPGRRRLPPRPLAAGGRSAAGRHAGRAGRRPHPPENNPADMAYLLGHLLRAGAAAGRRAGRASRRPRRVRQPGRRGQAAGHASRATRTSRAQAEGGGCGTAGHRAAVPSPPHTPTSTARASWPVCGRRAPSSRSPRCCADPGRDTSPWTMRVRGGPAAGQASREAPRSRSPRWPERAAAHIPLCDAGAGWPGCWPVCGRRAPRQQVTALLCRDPAAYVSVDDAGAVARLLASLREAGAEAAGHRAGRGAGRRPHPPLRCGCGGPAAGQSAGGGRRAAGHRAAVPRSGRIRLRGRCGCGGPAAGQLAGEAHTEQQVTALAERAAAHIPLCDAGAVARLLASIPGGRAPRQQVTALLCRDPAAYVSVDDAGAVARLLASLREAGAEQQVTALLCRDPAAYVSVDDAGAVARLLASLREAGDRAAGHRAGRAGRRPHPPLRCGCGGPAAGQLAGGGRRAAGRRAGGSVAGGRHVRALLRARRVSEISFRFGREADGSPAAPWGWEDLD